MITGIPKISGRITGFVTERSPMDEHHAPRNLKRDLVATMSGEVREHPFTSLLGSVGLGLLIGYLIRSGKGA
ncbi:MAG: hypothetical protein RLZZ245_1938 [Verrucomicrobiota bacterium]|jgi:ElaB/YqjD/DUF883 family membrane-anchored ribosome-binding protein